MRYIPSALQAHLNSASTTLCYLLKIVTRDGTVLGVTSHDQDITYDDGYGSVTYQASIGVDGSAVENTSGLEVDNAEATMLFADAGVFTQQQIEAGVMDYAQFTLYRVNWADLSMGHYIVQTGTTGAVKSHDNLAGVAELRGLPQQLKQNYVEQYSLTCRAVFGSGGAGGSACAERGMCNYDASTLWQSHSVAAVDSDENDRVFDADSAPAVVGADSNNIPMAPGLIEWLTGDNAGLYSEVEAHTDGTVGISLRFGTPYAIQVGDTFRIRPDCDKTWARCKDSYDNILNFRGEPLIPLTDANQQTPFATFPSFPGISGLGATSVETISDGEDPPTAPSSGTISVSGAQINLFNTGFNYVAAAGANFTQYPLRKGQVVTFSGSGANDGDWTISGVESHMLKFSGYLTGSPMTTESDVSFTIHY